MIQECDIIPMIGTVVYTPSRPATATMVWIEVMVRGQLALRDLVVIDSPRQAVLGIVVEMERVGASAVARTRVRVQPQPNVVTYAKIELVSASDMRQRPPEGTVARHPRPDEVAELLAEARRIPLEQRVAVGVIPVRKGFSPVTLDLHRLVGPTATSMLITGAAGSYKSSAGGVALCGIAHATRGRVAIVIINSKGEDLLFPDFARQACAAKYGVQPLRERDVAIYRAMGYAEPPVLPNVTAFVPGASDPTWRSSRPLGFPRTHSYTLDRDVAIRYACAPTDDDERTSSIVTRQCIEETAGPFADERGIATLPDLVAALTTEFADMVSERNRWRNQFQATTVAAALRQLQAAQRDLGPLLSQHTRAVPFPVDQLANGGTWVVDVAPLPHRAAQAVLDEVVAVLWQAKADGTIPHDLPLVLLCDELNRWSSRGTTLSRLATIVRDQRHRCFSLIGLAQSLSTLHPQMLDNVDAFWMGSTRSRELAEDVYNHLSPYLRGQLQRLPTGTRMLDAPPLTVPQLVEIPFPSFLIADEGLKIVDAWRARYSGARAA